MITFRYHIVSLTAVLLALAAGVVLGAGPLDGQLGTGGVTSEEQQAEIDTLDTQVQSLQGRVSYDDAAAAALAPAVLPRKLKKLSVVVVVTPGVEPGQVTALTDAVRASGAAVTGVVDVLPAWLDPDQGTVLGSLAAQLVPADAELPSGGVYAKAGAALATALVTNAAVPPSQPDETSVALLTGFEEGGFIDTTGDPAVQAQLALVVSPSPAKDLTPEAASATNDALLPLVAALDAGQGSVLAGAEGSADPGGLVAALRESGPVRRTVSSVDVADVPSGIIASVLALAQQSAGVSGQYGIGPGADAAMPPLQPGR